MNDVVIARLLEQLDARFGESDHEKRVFYSPSRVNIIGEHVDYNGGTVFPCAISIGTYGVARKNDSGVLNLYSVNLDVERTLTFPLPEYEEENDWTNYAAGVYKELKKMGYEVGGIDLVVEGDIPNSAGLSSSASLELLLGEIQNQLYNGGRIPRMDLIFAGVRCENDFIGLHTGVMDQSVIALGKKDHAVLLNTNTMEYKHIPFELGDYTLVIMNTNFRRELKDSSYNTRREECEEALADIQKVKDISALCDLGKDDLYLLDEVKNENAKKRARHVITDNLRVFEAVQAMQSGDIPKLGQILYEGNRSMREDFEATGPQLDAITGAANDFEGCVGARMTGGGFGGCAIAIVETPKVEEFIETVGKEYREKTGIEGQFILSGVEDGTHEIVK